MKNLYIIKTGSTFESTKEKYKDFEDWIIDKLDKSLINIHIIDVQNTNHLPDAKICDGVILTGSHSMVSQEEPWSLELEKWLQDIAKYDIYTLGICYGHQLLAKALGGVSEYHPKGMEIGSVEIVLSALAKEDKLFKDMPKIFYAHTIHSQSAIKLPKDAVILASNPHDPHHAFRLKENIWGVQFHPEFDENSMNSYIKEVGKLKGFEKDFEEKLLSEVKKTPQANDLLKRFESLVAQS